MYLKYNVWFFKNVLDKTWCDNIIKKYKTKATKKGKIGGDGVKISAKRIKERRNSNIVWVHEKEIYQKLNPYLHAANKNAGWNFEISWSEDIQFTKYTKGQYYNWHMDSFFSPYKNHRYSQYEGKIRKISCSVLLNDPSEYSGGDLEIGQNNNVETPLEDNKINMNQCNLGQGSIIFFPGFIWHRVTPIKKGTRYSLVMWTVGKPYV